jgi:hypothetical protein
MQTVTVRAHISGELRSLEIDVEATKDIPASFRGSPDRWHPHEEGEIDILDIRDAKTKKTISLDDEPEDFETIIRDVHSALLEEEEEAGLDEADFRAERDE